jgi:hypothetical protein
MKFVKLSIGLASVLLSGMAFAAPMSAPTINLGGLTVTHATAGKNTGSISLKPLANVSDDLSWNITCDYQVQETGNNSAPSATNPLVAQVTVNERLFYGNGYTGKGFVASSGVVKANDVFAEYPGNDFDSILVNNYDTTGDLTLSNCVATGHLSK